jgi:DNA-binding GntR family transcriptional regulator
MVRFKKFLTILPRIDLIYLKYQVDTLFSHTSDQAVKSHREIFNCLKARDCEGACSALTADIENVSRRVGDNMLKNLEEKEKFQI